MTPAQHYAAAESSRLRRIAQAVARKRAAATGVARAASPWTAKPPPESGDYLAQECILHALAAILCLIGLIGLVFCTLEMLSP